MSEHRGGRRGRNRAAEVPVTRISEQNRQGRRPFLHVIVLYASDPRVMRYSKEIQGQILDSHVDIFMQTELESGQQIRTEHLADVISKTKGDYLAVIGDRNMRNHSIQTRKRGKLIETKVEDVSDWIWSEWEQFQADELERIPVERLSEDDVYDLLGKYAGLRHVRDRLQRAKNSVKDLRDSKGHLAKGVGRAYAYDPSNSTPSLTDEKLAEQLTQMQKSLVRLHQQLSAALPILQELPIQEAGESISERGLLRPGSFVPSQQTVGLPLDLKSKLLTTVQRLLPKVEKLGSSMSSFGNPLWTAYMEELQKEKSEDSTESADTPPVSEPNSWSQGHSKPSTSTNSNKPSTTLSPKRTVLESVIISSNPQDDGVWKCATCTFDNRSTSSVCQVCEKPRGSASDESWTVPGRVLKKHQRKQEKEDDKRPQPPSSSSRSAVPSNQPHVNRPVPVGRGAPNVRPVVSASTSNIQPKSTQPVLNISLPRTSAPQSQQQSYAASASRAPAPGQVLTPDQRPYAVAAQGSYDSEFPALSSGKTNDSPSQDSIGGSPQQVFAHAPQQSIGSLVTSAEQLTMSPPEKAVGYSPSSPVIQPHSGSLTHLESALPPFTPPNPPLNSETNTNANYQVVPQQQQQQVPQSLSSLFATGGPVNQNDPYPSLAPVSSRQDALQSQYAAAQAQREINSPVHSPPHGPQRVIQTEMYGQRYMGQNKVKRNQQQQYVGWGSVFDGSIFSSQQDSTTTATSTTTSTTYSSYFPATSLHQQPVPNLTHDSAVLMAAESDRTTGNLDVFGRRQESDAYYSRGGQIQQQQQHVQVQQQHGGQMQHQQQQHQQSSDREFVDYSAFSQQNRNHYGNSATAYFMRQPPVHGSDPMSDQAVPNYISQPQVQHQAMSQPTTSSFSTLNPAAASFDVARAREASNGSQHYPGRSRETSTTSGPVQYYYQDEKPEENSDPVAQAEAEETAFLQEMQIARARVEGKYEGKLKPERQCCYCTEEAVTECSTCARIGYATFFCSPDHQAKMWKRHQLWHEQLVSEGGVTIPPNFKPPNSK